MEGNDDREPGGWVYFTYLWTLAPWAFMQFFDAIDAKKRHVEGLPWRLGLSFFLNFTSTGVGLWYVFWSYSRSTTESATMLIGVVLNSWYWKRNLRGWRSYRVLLAQKGNVCALLVSLMNMRMQGMPPYRGEYHRGNNNLEEGDNTHVAARDFHRKWPFLWVNDKVIDNDRREDNISLASGSW